MSDRELKLHATISELLAYLDVDQEPEKFLQLIGNGKPAQKNAAFPLAEQIALKAAELCSNTHTDINLYRSDRQFQSSFE